MYYKFAFDKNHVAGCIHYFLTCKSNAFQICSMSVKLAMTLRSPRSPTAAFKPTLRSGCSAHALNVTLLYKQVVEAAVVEAEPLEI